MSSLYCSYNSRDKSGCLFNVDCNMPKQLYNILVL